MVTLPVRPMSLPRLLGNAQRISLPRVRGRAGWGPAVSGVCLAIFFIALALYQFPTTRIAVFDTQVPYFALALIPVLAVAAVRLYREAIRRAVPLLGILLLLALATCVTGLAHPDQDWGEALKRLAYVGVGIVVFAVAAGDRFAFRIGLSAYVATAAVMAVIGFVLLAQGFGEAGQTFYFGLHYSAATRNGDAYFLLLPLFIALGFFAASSLPGWTRALAAIAVVVLLAGIALSFSRGAWLAAAAGLLLFLLMARQRRWPVLGMLVAVVIGGVLILPLVTPLPVTAMLADRAASITQLDTSIHNSTQERLRLLEDTARVIAQHPFTGTGVGLLERAYSRMPDVLGLAHAENAYVTVFAEYGLLGLAAIAAFTFWPLKRLWPKIFSPHAETLPPPLRITLFCGLVALTLNGLTDNPVAGAAYWILPLFLGAAA